MGDGLLQRELHRMYMVIPALLNGMSSLLLEPSQCSEWCVTWREVNKTVELRVKSLELFDAVRAWCIRIGIKATYPDEWYGTPKDEFSYKRLLCSLCKEQRYGPGGIEDFFSKCKCWWHVMVVDIPEVARKDLRAAQMKGPLAVAIHEVKTTLPLLLASARGGPFIKVSQKGLEWNMRTVGKDVRPVGFVTDGTVVAVDSQSEELLMCLRGIYTGAAVRITANETVEVVVSPVCTLSDMRRLFLGFPRC
jgi:hypothetical protein